MKKGLMAFFKAPQTKIGILTALMFQVIFSLIWMTAYDGVTERVDRFTIAAVNEDGAFGTQLVDGFQKNTPFRWETGLTEPDAREALERRELQMVVKIPAGFGERLQAPGEAASLEYTMNGSNAMMVSSVMDSTAAKITDSVNRMVLAQAAPELSGKMDSKVETIHPVDGMNNQMVPMMLVLASYVGTMIMGMNLQQASGLIGSELSGWQRFGARTVINLVSSLAIALVGTSLVFALGGQANEGFFAFWSFQSLIVLAFLFFSQMFLQWFGMAGMLFNIAALSLQLVTSGALVPRQLLNGFYHATGDFLPATYAVEGLMNIQFGGAGTISSRDIVWLGVIAAASLLVGLAAELFKGRGPKRETAKDQAALEQGAFAAE